MNEKTITIKKDDLWKYSTFILGALVIVLLFITFSGDKENVEVGTINSPPPPPPPPEKVQVSMDDDAVLGDKNAKVTIIEFSDYQCPFCRKFWQDTLPNIKKDYIDTGKVKLAYRDFPLGFHPNAIPSAVAAECAREIGKGDAAYFKMHDKIFEEQNKLDGGSVKSTVQFTTDDLKKWAKEIGFDIGKCLDSNKYANEVQKDQQDGASAGVGGTPGFFVNGKPISGAQPYEVFKQAIDAELN